MNELPTSTYFDYRNTRQVLDGVVYELTAFGHKRPRGIVWECRTVPLSTRLIATQPTVDAGIVARYVANQYARTAGSQTTVPVLLDIDGRMYIFNGHHRIVAAIQRGDSYVGCWVGRTREPP